MTKLLTNSICSFGAWIGLALVLGACATVSTYQVQTPGATVAKLEINVQNFGNMATSEVWAFHDDQCTVIPGFGLVNRTEQGVTQRVIDLEANRELFIRVNSHEYENLPVNRYWWSRSCLVMMRLTPIAGKTYRLNQRGLGRQTCQITLEDQETGKAPTELKRIPTVDLQDRCLGSEAKQRKERASQP